MQHIGFILFLVLVLALAVYGIFQAGVIPRTNLGFINGSSTTQTQSRQTAAKQNSASNANTQTVIQRPATQQTQSVYNANGYSPRADASHPTTPTYYGQLTLNPSEIPPGFSIRDISPYFKQIRISASPGSPGFYSQITINANLPTTGGSLDVTGWLIKGNRGSLYISKAVDVYNPSGLTPEGDIYLKNGDNLTIYSTNSAVGVNLRINKCIGYLQNANKFTPPINLSCPAVERSEIINFTSPCQNYILSLGSCQMPAPNPPIPYNDYSCINYLNKLNYGGCFEKHRNDYDFLSNQWNVWSGTHFLDFQHDRVLLFDRNGLLVSEYVY